MNEIQNTPELRFEGFTEPWEQRKVSDIATLRRGLTYSPSDVVSPGQGVRVLRSSNIVEDRFVLRDDDVFVREEAVNIPFSRDGEILITAANGSTRLVGKRAKISGLTGKTVHGGFMLIAATEQPDFLCALMGTEWYRNFLRVGVAGGNGAIGNLDSHALECEKVSIPSNAEQRAIGDFFSNLDYFITLQQRKYERLQHLKQAMLRKMFPKPDEQVPELRFEGFTEPWEQRKVSDIATLRRGLTYSPSDVVSPGQGVRVLRSSNIVEDRFVLRDDDVFVREEAVNIPFSRDGEILITAANGSTRLVGKRAKISGLTGKTVHGGFMLIAATEQPDFLCALMGTEWYRNFLRVGVAGGNGAIGNLDSHALECEKVSIPSNAEQRAIGDFFSNLDYFITLQQRKYERLQHLKQAMLQRMFV
ncbi:restriction endonuclease subunit S [Bifidobacterium bifidum]